MKVYIVSRGERSKGGSVIGVYKTLPLARHAAMTQPSHWGDWVETDTNYWVNGCDCVEVSEHEVI